MARYLPLVILIFIIALPFVLRHMYGSESSRLAHDSSAARLIIVTPHNEAIRYEFELAFSKWHQGKFGQSVQIDWRNIGGTTEISRYLASEYTAAMKAWRRQRDLSWPNGAADAMLAREASNDPALAELWKQYRDIDNPKQLTANIDLFFGGGEFDHSNAFRSGFTVAPWTDPQVPDSLSLIPETLSGEVWRTKTLFGAAISAFGIVYNVDRLKDLNVSAPPAQWRDLADPVYFRQVGVADPTKSGSIAKAFEMIIHQQMHDAAADFLRANGTAPDQLDSAIESNEKRIESFKANAGKNYQRGDVPEDLKGYQAALERGWEEGILLVQSIGANARYFTDSASKVPIDVSMGDAAVGMAIDFYGRFQAQSSRTPDGVERMIFTTPIGGTSVSCDPIGLLRGAPHRDIAVRFIEFVLSEEGQRLWTYKAGAPGGPEKFALRRLPIRRDFYPSEDPAMQEKHVQHRKHAVDDLAAPSVDPYQLATTFRYYRRWTFDHFSIQSYLIRAMCLDSANELKDAWEKIHHSTQNREEAIKLLRQLPTIQIRNKTTGNLDEVPLTWRIAPDIRRNYEMLDYMKEWTEAFRENYRKAAQTP